LRERGALHEQASVDHLRSQGYEITGIDGSDISTIAVAETRRVLQRGAPVAVASWRKFVPQSFRFAGYAAYFRRVQSGLPAVIAAAAVSACEVCRDPNEVRAAYRRTNFLEERRAVMQAWCNFVCPKDRFVQHVGKYRFGHATTA
jgi:hypothetical protein